MIYLQIVNQFLWDNPKKYIKILKITKQIYLNLQIYVFLRQIKSESVNTLNEQVWKQKTILNLHHDPLMMVNSIMNLIVSLNTIHISLIQICI